MYKINDYSVYYNCCKRDVLVLIVFFLIIYKRIYVLDKEIWFEWIGWYWWEEKEKIIVEYDVYCDLMEDWVFVYVLKM